MFLVSRSPRVCLAFRSLEKCRVSGNQGSASLLVQRVPPKDFCKRSVSEWRSSSVAFVASAYGQNPKNVLQGTFNKTRRAARTEMFLRMSRLLARTTQRQFVSTSDFCSAYPKRPSVSKCEFAMTSAKSSWRPLSAIVSKVMRDVRVTPVANPHPQAIRLSALQ